MSTGEWLEYDINVGNSGSYQAQIRVASKFSSGLISFAVDGSKVTGNHAIGKTGGWQSWVTQTVNLGNISAGRLNVENSSLNINWINIVSTGTSGANTGSGNSNASASNDFGLNPNDEPWENFDLTRWALDTPAPRDDDACRAERTWDHNWESSG